MATRCDIIIKDDKTKTVYKEIKPNDYRFEIYDTIDLKKFLPEETKEI